MRRIKARPIKRLTFKPPEGSIIRYVTPIEAAVMAQESYDEHDRRQTWQQSLPICAALPRTTTMTKKQAFAIAKCCGKVKL